jgi:hypothetical protein
MNNKFKIISMGRVGTLALNRFVNDHPQIALPAFKTTTSTFQNLYKEKKHFFDELNFSETHQGVVIHDAAFYDKKFRKNLGVFNQIKVDSIIHCVRNPFEQAVSWINHINSAACAEISGWKTIDANAKSFYQRYKIHFQTILPGLQCETFYKNHKQVKIIDFKELGSEKIEQTMSDVFQFLGVDSSYQCSFLHQTQNSYTREILSKGFKFILNDEVVEVLMAPVDTYFHHEKNVKPWVVVHDTHEIFAHCPTLPKLEGDLVFLPVSFAAHNNLSLKTRQMLHQGIADIISEIMPVWAKEAEQTAQKIEELKIKKLDDQDYEFLHNALKKDLAVFTSYYPKFKSLWNL